MIELGAVVTGSLLSSAHCVGMCGGFAVTVGAGSPSFTSLLSRQLIYTSGRIFTYAFLGAVGGFAGQSLAQYNGAFITSQRVFSILAGLIMVFVGLSSIGWIPRRQKGVGVVGKIWSTLFSQFLTAKGRWGRFLAGIATGFLPCGLVYTFLALAVACGNMVEGMVLMAAFGAGTAPAMILIGCGSNSLSRAARARVLGFAAVAMIVMGGMSIYRAIPHENACCAPEADCCAGG